MNTFSFIRLGIAGRGAVLRWSPFVVVWSLLGACDDDNQAPFASVDTLPTTRVMTAKSTQVHYIDEYFWDPDGDPLSAIASIEDPAVATAVVEDVDDSLRLVIEGVTAGETTLRLTAMDPDGGEAEVLGQVLVVEPVLFWRDDFDVNTGLWRLDGSYSYDHRPGYLSGIGQRFGAWRSDPAMDWLVSMSVGTEEGATNQMIGFGQPRARPDRSAG